MKKGSLSNEVGLLLMGSWMVPSIYHSCLNVHIHVYLIFFQLCSASDSGVSVVLAVVAQNMSETNDEQKSFSKS